MPNMNDTCDSCGYPYANHGAISGACLISGGTGYHPTQTFVLMSDVCGLCGTTYGQHSGPRCYLPGGRFHPSNTFTHLSATVQASVPATSTATTATAARPNGMACKSCGTFNSYAEPNRSDGSHVCYSCKTSGH